MESAVEGDDLVAARVIARQLDGRLDRFRAGVAEVDALRRLAPGAMAASFSRQLHHIGIIKIRAGHVDQLGGLLLNRRDDFGMAMAGGDDGDARGEIQEDVAVHVFDQRAAAALATSG